VSSFDFGHCQMNHYLMHNSTVAGGKVSEVAPNATAVHPSWRNSLHSFLLSSICDTNTPLSERRRVREQLTEETQKLAALVPGAGSYVNECLLNSVPLSCILY
jgi:hypothetical protein